MSPGDALDRGQASKCQEVGERVHADLGIVENVQVLVGDLPPREVQVPGQGHHLAGALDEGAPPWASSGPGEPERHRELGAGQVADEPEVELADRVAIKKRRQKANADRPPGVGPEGGRTAVRSHVLELGGGAAIDRGEACQQVAVVPPLVGQVEGRRTDRLGRVGDREDLGREPRQALLEPAALGGSSSSSES